jgi:hypothetical protein
MDIKTFMEQCVGKWFAQRTCYQLTENQSESAKAEVTMAWLATDAAPIQTLCANAAIAPETVWGGLDIHWDNSVDSGQPKQVGGTVMAFAAPNAPSPSGQLLRADLAVGTYDLGADEALTLTVQDGPRHYEERIWFASENLRFRTVTIQNAGVICQAAFYSEIRRMQS